MSNQMEQLQEATIKAQCKTLRMPMIASQFGKLRALSRGWGRVSVSGCGRASREGRRGADYQSAVFRMDPGHPQRSTLQSLVGSNHRSCSHSGEQHGILPLPPHCRQAKEGSQDALTAGQPWKCRSVESLENQTQGFPPSHRPWKSLRDSHIPTASTRAVPVIPTA
jgi:hypothetical protein